ncbi:FdhD protein [Mumia flava]|uniref:Sulfur carrier protein FdhD n=1 Tax=Mumia flava TaxID=1348852 RepID=A0A2M9B635_9ACTN|nr:FdhD protein [Mumia flava]
MVEWADGSLRAREDRVLTEEPLEIRVSAAGEPPRRFGVTMRTPGADFELAAGLLLAEGVVAGIDDLARVAYCTDETLRPDQRFNVVTVDLTGPVRRSWVDRQARATSACGVCGTDSLDEVEALAGRTASDRAHAAPAPPWDPALLAALPDRLRTRQQQFDRTGGAHAAGIFTDDTSTADSGTVVVREDVGRHNAVDKAVGYALLNRVDVAGDALCTSGRVGFEIVQKAAVAGIGAVVGVGAPTTLAIDLAERAAITLAAFARDGRVVLHHVPQPAVAG